MFGEPEARPHAHPIPSPFLIALGIAVACLASADCRGAGPPRAEAPWATAIQLTGDATLAVLSTKRSWDLELCPLRFSDGGRTALRTRVWRARAISLSRDSSRMAVAGGKTVEMFTMLPAPKSVRVVSLGGDVSLVAVAVSPDGNLVAAGGVGRGKADSTVSVIDVKSGDVACSLDGHTLGGQALAFTRDGKRLLTGDGDGVVRCWSVPAGQLVWQQAHFGSEVGAIRCLSTKVVSGGWDGRLCVTDLGTGKIEGKWRAHRKMVHSIAVSADQKLAATFGADGMLKLWDIEKKALVADALIPFRQDVALHILPGGGVLTHCGALPRLFMPHGGRLIEVKYPPVG